MPETITVTRHRRQPTVYERLRRSFAAMRSSWSGPFTLKDPALNRLFGIGSRTAAGPIVTEHTMFTCSAVFNAIDQISSDTAKLPLNLKKRRKDGGSDDYIESRTYRLMKYAPNPEMRPMEFRRQLMVHALVAKGGYAEIERDANDRPVALWPIEAHRVQPFYAVGERGPDGRMGPMRYRVDGEDVFEARDILHIQGLSYDGLGGMEMVNVAREAIGLALASQQFASAFFGNGTRFGGILMAKDRDLDPGDTDTIAIQEAIEKLHAKADRAFRMLVLGAGFEYKEAGTKPSDAQMKEIRDQQVMEVARFYDVPLHRMKLALPGVMSYASVEQADLAYYKGPILNWITLWEQECNAKLIPPLELGLQFFKHNERAFLRGDFKTQQEGLALMRIHGIVNADEWREWMDLNPQTDGQGKVYLVQGAQMPVDLLIEKVKADIEKAKQPPPPPAAPAPAPADDDANDTRTMLHAIVGLLEQRLGAADTAVSAQQQLVTDLRSQLATMEATGTATEEVRAALAAEVQRQQDLLTSMTTIADGLRSDLASAREGQVAAEAARSTADAAREAAVERETAALAERDRLAALAEAATVRAGDAETRATALAADRDASEVARVEAQQEAERAREIATTAQAASLDAAMALSDSQRAAQDAEQRVARAEATLEEQVVAHTAALAEAEARAAAALVQRDALAQAADTARAEREAEQQRLAETERNAEALQQQLTVLEASHLASAADIGNLREALAALEQERAALRTALASREAAAADEAARRAAAETALAAERQANRDRLTAVLAAHRGLIVDALGRMTRRECQQARSKEATPEKLRRWLATFPELHRAICVEALEPAIRTHLAWQRSADDSQVVTERLVTEHVAAFEAQLRLALESDPEDFHAVLDRILTRWESERAATVADAFLVEAVRYVQEQ